MADNVGYTPGTGATVAADEIAGVLHQRVKIGVGGDGVAVDVSQENPMPVVAYGELVEAIEALRMAVQSLTRSGLGQSMPDTAGRLRVLAENPTASAFNATISLAGGQTLATLSTLTNITQIGGLSATEGIPSLMRLGADASRKNIIVT
jgi:hypothetical protein